MGLREELHEALDIRGFPDESMLWRTVSRVDGALPRRPRTLRFAPVIAAFIAVLLVVTLIADRLNASPTSQSGLPTATTIDNLVDYKFVSPEVGWIHIYSSGDVIATTSDGGRSWRRVLTVSGLYPGATMQVVDARTAVLFGSRQWNSPLGAEAVVWKTVDGGAHWQLSVVTTEGANLIGGVAGYFLDSRHGWVLIQEANCGGGMACPMIVIVAQRVFETDDGGGQWTELPPITGLRAPNVTLRFISPTVGIAVGTYLNELGVGGTVATTHDGGRTWKSTNIPPPVRGCPAASNCGFASTMKATMFDASGGVLQLKTYDAANNGFALVSATLYATFDGGLTWTLAPALQHDGGEGVAIYLGFDMLIDVTPQSVSLKPGWYLADAEFMGVDSGWVRITNSTLWRARDIAFAGVQFQILSTSDGGRTWRPIPLPRA